MEHLADIARLECSLSSHCRSVFAIRVGMRVADIPGLLETKGVY